MGWHARAAPGKLQGNLEEAWGKLQGGLEESSAFDRAQPSPELSPGQSSTLDRAQPRTELTLLQMNYCGLHELRVDQRISSNR